MVRKRSSRAKYYLNKNEINLSWNAADLREVTRFHRPLWIAYKEKNGIKSNTPVHEIPGFLESLEILHLRGNSFNDLGAMFGLDRESIIHYFKNYRLRFNKTREQGFRKTSMARIWDDEKNDFVPISSGDVADVLMEKGY